MYYIMSREGVSDSAATYHCDVSAGGGVVVQSHSAYTHQAPPDPPPAKGQHNHQQAEGKTSVEWSILLQGLKK